MANLSFNTERKNGTWTEQSRKVFKNQFKNLPLNGKFKIAVERQDATPTRYKYYFDYLCFVILHQAGEFLKFINKEGDLQDMKNTKDVHQYLKMRFNAISIIDKTTGQVFNVARSTLNLSDRDFIGKFSEAIIAEFSAEPYFCDLTLSFEDWKFHHQERNWFAIKGLIKQKKELNQNNIDNFEYE